MFCGNCGKEIEDGTKFCTNCGWAIPIAVVSETVEKPTELRCSACGTLFKEGEEFCGNCGNKINNRVVREPSGFEELPSGLSNKSNVEANSNQTGYSANTSLRVRHGFTTFWLILGTIGNFITGIFYFFFFQDLLYGLNIYLPHELVVGYGFISMLVTGGYIILLCWKGIGCLMIIIGVIISLILNIQAGVDIPVILLGLISPAVLWGVLHIRKNGKTTWEQLDW